MKLEVGQFVRTKDGGIKKITNFKPITKYTKYNTLNFDNTLGELLFTDEELKEIKASHNIIDLIEVGDYVNGYYVEDVLESFINVATGSNYFQSPTIYENDIKSIVTSQQFESISYIVGDSNE